jgi:FKBP-type peptidyl-prolyl cis-trans isomerase 2
MTSATVSSTARLAVRARPTTTRTTTVRSRRTARVTRPATSDDDGELPNVDFIGTILQDVRKGQKGFATRMRVERDDEEEADNAYPVVGDVVRIRFGVETGEGEVLQDAAAADAVTFEVGASDVMGNPLFKAFDEAVRTLRVGASATVSASGGDYDPNLLFSVPANHEEIGRLRAEWADKGGLVEGLTVTLANDQPAVVRAIDERRVVLDANHPFAGDGVFFTVTLLGVNEEGVEAF